MKQPQLTSTAKKSTSAPTVQPKRRVTRKSKKSFFTKIKKGGKKSLGQQQNYGNEKLDENYCDCFDDECLGCHFECEVCGSQKCGNICRRNRSFIFETIEYDGSAKVVTNKFLKAKV